MPFVEVRLNEIKLEKPTPIPAGEYVFQLLPGAAYRTNPYSNIEELNVSAAIAEGELAGRTTFFNYIDPTSISKKGKVNTWSEQALKRLEVSLGVDALPGEDPATYLNRVATNGQGRFTGTMAPGKYIPNGETEPRVEFQLFGVSAAA